MRARESQIHTQTDGWIDRELTGQNIESNGKRKRTEEGDSERDGTRKHLVS